MSGKSPALLGDNPIKKTIRKPPPTNHPKSGMSKPTITTSDTANEQPPEDKSPSVVTRKVVGSSNPKPVVKKTIPKSAEPTVSKVSNSTTRTNRVEPSQQKIVSKAVPTQPSIKAATPVKQISKTPTVKSNTQTINSSKPTENQSTTATSKRENEIAPKDTKQTSSQNNETSNLCVESVVPITTDKKSVITSFPRIARKYVPSKLGQVVYSANDTKTLSTGNTDKELKNVTHSDKPSNISRSASAVPETPPTKVVQIRKKITTTRSAPAKDLVSLGVANDPIKKLDSSVPNVNENALPATTVNRPVLKKRTTTTSKTDQEQSNTVNQTKVLSQSTSGNAPTDRPNKNVKPDGSAVSVSTVQVPKPQTRISQSSITVKKEINTDVTKQSTSQLPKTTDMQSVVKKPLTTIKVKEEKDVQNTDTITLPQQVSKSVTPIVNKSTPDRISGTKRPRPTTPKDVVRKEPKTSETSNSPHTTKPQTTKTTPSVPKPLITPEKKIENLSSQMVVDSNVISESPIVGTKRARRVTSNNTPRKEVKITETSVISHSNNPKIKTENTTQTTVKSPILREQDSPDIHLHGPSKIDPIPVKSDNIVTDAIPTVNSEDTKPVTKIPELKQVEPTPAPKKRGRPRLYPKKEDTVTKHTAVNTGVRQERRTKTKIDTSPSVGNVNNIVAYIGSQPVENIHKELLSGSSPEVLELAHLCIRYLETVIGIDQVRRIAGKIVRVLGAIRRKSISKTPGAPGSKLDCIAYVGDIPPSLQKTGEQSVSIDEVKSWYDGNIPEQELTHTVNTNEGTYKIAIRPEALQNAVQQRMEKMNHKISVKVPLPSGCQISSMNEFMSRVNQLGNADSGLLLANNGQNKLGHPGDSDPKQTHCPGPQHKNWLQDRDTSEAEFKRYIENRATYYESIYQSNTDEDCEKHISEVITRSHVNVMLRMPVEPFFKLCTNNDRCETYKLCLFHDIEPFVGVAYLSLLELEYAMEQKSPPIEEGLCYLCILSCYTSQYTQNSASGSPVRIKVPFQHQHSIPGEYVPQAMIAQTTGMTNGLLTPLRPFCVSDYVPVLVDVTTSTGSIVKDVQAFEEKGHLVFRYSSRNPQPLSTDPQQSYTVSCAPPLTTCYLLREYFRSGVTSKRQITDIIELYHEDLTFIQKSYLHLIIGPSSANPNGLPSLVDRIFIAPPKPTRRRSVTIKTGSGPDRRNTQLSSSSVSHILLSGTGRNTRNTSNIPHTTDYFDDSEDVNPYQITYTTFNGCPFDAVFSDSISTTMEYVHQLCSLFGYKQSGVDGTEIIRYPFISLYDDKKIELQRARAYKNSLKTVHEFKRPNNSSDPSGDDNGDETNYFEEGEEMFFLDDYKFYHAIMIRSNIAWSIGESISMSAGLSFSQVLEVLDNMEDPHRDTQANKESAESKELKERTKLYEKLGRQFLIKKLVQFIEGHRNVLDFFHKHGAISDEELMTVRGIDIYIPSKVKEWRTVMKLLEPKIQYKYDKLDENYYKPDISHHQKPPPRERITNYLCKYPDLYPEIPRDIFGEFEVVRYQIQSSSDAEIQQKIQKCSGFPHWNIDTVPSRMSNRATLTTQALSSCTIYVTLLSRIHYSYELLETLGSQVDKLINQILEFVNSNSTNPKENYESYHLANDHLSLIDMYERIPGDDGQTGGNICESDFFRVFYMLDLDRYRSATYCANTNDKSKDGQFSDILDNSSDTLSSSPDDIDHNIADEDSSQDPDYQSSETPDNKYSYSDDQMEPWITFSKALLSKSSKGRHHVYTLRRRLLEIRKVIYQIRAFVCTHTQLAAYLITNGIITDDEIISNRTESENGVISNYIINYPGDHRFYGEGSQPDCVTSHMYVNFFSQQGTENRVWYYLIGKLLPRCCQSRKWYSKHTNAVKTCESYRLWVCMCLRVSLTGMYKTRRQWLKFDVLLQAENTCKTFFTDKQSFLNFQEKHPGLVMTSLRECMIWQIELNPALIRVYLEYFQQWRNFGFTVQHKMESISSILDMSGKVRDICGVIDQLFSTSRFVFRRVCFDFVAFILGIFKEINGTLSEDGNDPSGKSSKRKTATRTQKKRTTRKTQSQSTGNEFDDESITRRSLYYGTADNIANTNKRPEKLSEQNIALIDKFVEFMNPHEDIDLRALTMVGISPEGIDNLRFVYGLFLAGEQNRSSATMLKQMSPLDYELSFYFFTAVRMHSSIIAISCDYSDRQRKLAGIRAKYAIGEGDLPDASTAIVFSQCCSSMKSLGHSGEGPRYYGHQRTVYSEKWANHVCWAKREKGQRKRLPKEDSSTTKKRGTLANSNPITKTPDPNKFQQNGGKPSHDSIGHDKKDRYSKICGETSVIAIPGTFVIQHNPLKERPFPTSFTICPGKKCGSITPFSLSMWGPNGFTCGICDKADRDNVKTPRCDICKATKKRSLSWVQLFMYDDIPGTGKIEQFLVCPLCARKCAMEDRRESNRSSALVHEMTFLECHALIERVVKVTDREQQFAWEHWKPRKNNKQPKSQQQQQQQQNQIQAASKTRIRKPRKKNTVKSKPTGSKKLLLPPPEDLDGDDVLMKDTPNFDDLTDRMDDDFEEDDISGKYHVNISGDNDGDLSMYGDDSDEDLNLSKTIKKSRKSSKQPLKRTHFSTKIGRMPYKRKH